MTSEAVKPFSERIGAAERPKELLVDRVSVELRNSLWNLFHSLYDDSNWDYWDRVSAHVAQFFRKVPVDDLPYRNRDCMRWLKEYFFSLEWYRVYDFLEFIVANHSRMSTISTGGFRPHEHPVRAERLREMANSILERELSGYRFVTGVLAPISSSAEAAQIQDAAALASAKGLHGAHQHLRTALELLGRRPNPDFRNSIKESISAVESVARVVSGSDSGGLEPGLDALAKATGIHGALKAGFLKLYGYSSDEDGIRHAILDEPNVGFDEAKYMLVSCSAFVHYMISKADKAGLLKQPAG